MLSCSSIYSTLLLQLTKSLLLGKEQLISVRMISTIGYKFYKSYIHKLVLVLSCPPLWWVVLLLVCLCKCRKVKKGTICQSYNLGKIIHLNVEINSGSASPNIRSSFGHPTSQTSISRRYYSHNYDKKNGLSILPLHLAFYQKHCLWCKETPLLQTLKTRRTYALKKMSIPLTVTLLQVMMVIVMIPSKKNSMDILFIIVITFTFFQYQPCYQLVT